jgi:hypothetical protein
LIFINQSAISITVVQSNSKFILVKKKWTKRSYIKDRALDVF